MPLSSVDRPDLLTDRVFRALHAGIMSGELAAGTQLKVRDLAEQVGTSVMPVREAIRRLEESGLAVREPHKGAVVKNQTAAEITQMYEVRLLLEVEAARLGAPRVSDADLVTMRELDAQEAVAIADGDVIASLDLDEAVLAVVYAAAGNPVLLESVRTLWHRCRPYKLRGAQRWLESADDAMWAHRSSVIAAAEAHDGEAAAAVVRESLISATERIQATFAPRP